MKISKSVLIVLAFLCLISEARAQFNQYTLMRRGQVSAYDSSVNVEIGEYRKIRAKVLTADSVYRSLSEELFLAYQQIKYQDQQVGYKDVIIQRHENTIVAKDSTITELRAVNKESLTLLKSFRISPVPAIDTGLKVGGGILIGIIVRSLIAR